MKKILATIILLACIGCVIYSNIALNNIKIANSKVNKDIKNVVKKIEKVSKDNTIYIEEIDKLRKNNQSKNEELLIWEKAKGKLKKALQ